MSALKSCLFLITIVTLGLCGCTYSSTYPPAVNARESAVLDSIKARYGFEDIILQGKKSSGSNGDHTVLTIKLINGKNIPADETGMTDLAKQLASKIKKTLKNQQEFESYTLLFDTRVVNGAITTETNSGHDFKADEL